MFLSWSFRLQARKLRCIWQRRFKFRRQWKPRKTSWWREEKAVRMSKEQRWLELSAASVLFNRILVLSIGFDEVRREIKKWAVWRKKIWKILNSCSARLWHMRAVLIECAWRRRAEENEENCKKAETCTRSPGKKLYIRLPSHKNRLRARDWLSMKLRWPLREVLLRSIFAERSRDFFGYLGPLPENTFRVEFPRSKKILIATGSQKTSTSIVEDTMLLNLLNPLNKK